MNMPTVLIGAAAILFGVYTLWARVARPGRFAKLAAMKDRWGSTGGNVVHVIAYTVVPIVVGVVFLVTGLNGRSIF
jgi:hypothetical protein